MQIVKLLAGSLENLTMKKPRPKSITDAYMKSLADGESASQPGGGIRRSQDAGDPRAQHHAGLTVRGVWQL